MWRKRALIIVCLFVSLFMLLIGRLMQIQLFETQSFSKHEVNLLEESVAQRSQEIVIDSGRGGFLDKEGNSLTHQTIPVLILFPFLKNTDWDAEKIANIINVSPQTFINTIDKAKEPFAYGTPKPMYPYKKANGGD